MKKNLDKIRPSISFMKSMGKIKSQWKRCRVVMVVDKFMNIFKRQIMRTRLEEESFLFMEKGNASKPSDSDSHGEESWVSWHSWIGWDEIEDAWRWDDQDRRNIFQERPRSQRHEKSWIRLR